MIYSDKAYALKKSYGVTLILNLGSMNLYIVG